MLQIKRKVWCWYIEGASLKSQREAAGLTQRALADLICVAIDSDIIEINQAHRKLNQKLISRDMEGVFEFSTNKATALVIQKILS